RRGRSRNSTKPDRIRAGGVAAVRSFVARGGVRRRVVNGLLGVESACARTGDRDAGAAIPVAAQRDAPFVGTAGRPRRGSGRAGEGGSGRVREREKKRLIVRQRFPPLPRSPALPLPRSLTEWRSASRTSACERAGI